MGILIENLSFSYGDIPVLTDISLRVETGETVGLIGASGCGKSTLLKLICGLYDCNSGIIQIDGMASSSDRRKAVSVVMQSYALFPAAIRDNITCGHDMDDNTIDHACEAAQLAAWLGELPDGLGTFVGERGGNVSGGQAQRIAIARAIVKNAPVMLLDEPTSALDETTSAALLTALRSLNNLTVVHISHKPETLTGCNRIYLLENGSMTRVA